MLQTASVVYFHLFLYIIWGVMLEMRHKGKTGDKDNRYDMASLRQAKKIWQGLGDSVWILDLSEAQERDELKSQRKFVAIFMGSSWGKSR